MHKCVNAWDGAPRKCVAQTAIAWGAYNFALFSVETRKDVIARVFVGTLWIDQGLLAQMRNSYNLSHVYIS